MLIEQSLGEFWDGTALTAGTTASEILDLAQARHQVGVGGELWLWLRTNVAAVFDSTQTYLFAFIVDTVEAMNSTPKAVIVIADSDGTAIVTADAESTPLKTAGKTIFAGSLPYNADWRYGKWEAILANGGGTASITLDAQLLAGPPPANAATSQIYASNITVPS
jgi:hypothetical protein